MTQNSFGLESAAVSDRGLSEKRPQNEDSYLEMSSRGLFAVADGVGGAQAGDVASQMAMEILGEAFTNLPEGGDVEELMHVAIERANGAIYQMSHDLPQLSTMATTIVALHVDGNIATIGHVGDSRLYRVDSKGNLFRETQDHSVVEEEVRAGRMTAAQAANHPSRNVISRALGAENTVEIDMKTIMFEPNTTFLLCSDGITRHIEDNELRQLLNTDASPNQICDDMKNICYGRGAEDNLTAVIVRVAETGVENLTDAEESTVAAVRPPMVNTGVFANAAATAADTAEIPTQNLQMPETEDFSTHETLDGSRYPISSPGVETNGAVIQPAAEARETIAAPERIERETVVEEKGEGSFLGKFISAVVLLLLGAVAGAAAYYFWQKSQPQQAPVVQEQPKITQMQTPDIPFSAFEKNRRNVDEKPEQFITANGSMAKDAEDFYLLGRAYLLMGDYKNAWVNFDKAKQNLAQTKAENKATLANEIALGMTIADVERARNYFKTTRDSLNPANPANANSNTNAAGAANTDTEIKPISEGANINNAPIQ